MTDFGKKISDYKKAYARMLDVHRLMLEHGIPAGELHKLCTVRVDALEAELNPTVAKRARLAVDKAFGMKEVA